MADDEEDTIRRWQVHPCWVWRAAALAQLGEIDLTKREAAQLLRMDSKFAISRWIGLESYARPEDAEHLAAGLRKAGLPE